MATDNQTIASCIIRVYGAKAEGDVKALANAIRACVSMGMEQGKALELARESKTSLWRLYRNARRLDD